MLSHEESTDLLDSTMSVLGTDFTTSTPQSGTGVIDEWLVELRKAENATEITTTLEQVKTELESGQINTTELSQLFNRLATQTVEFSTLMGSEGDIAPRLEGLSSALRSLAGQLGNQ
ncbi:hypothetical protein [Spirosoma endbachense]|uniref:Uncharacterized protein n=1 Tax=Spirosoma endbachense TaxID=2666025 RepID=A0A6P1VML4_9BACT|nr:hypothetical protein [Spirosoma endbachense]QHV94521.1 hypothetical protein GJR95_05610 [Spirosoma endbachense]